MLQALLGRFGPKKPFPNEGLAEGQAVYAVGDVHGRADLLRELHALILEDGRRSAAPEKTIVYLGDYVDRGPYVRDTLDLLVFEPLPGFHRHCLIGNHEQLFLAFLEDPRALEPWLELGGQSTLLSYGVQPPSSGFSPERGETIRRQILAALPEEHFSFLGRLRPYCRIGGYLFVHAGIRPGVPLEKQKADDMLWIRDEFLESRTDHRFRVVHGHTIRERVQDRPNRLGIDTGAYATGILTCAVFEKHQVRFLATSSAG